MGSADTMREGCVGRDVWDLERVRVRELYSALPRAPDVCADMRMFAGSRQDSRRGLNTKETEKHWRGARQGARQGVFESYLYLAPLMGADMMM